MCFDCTMNSGVVNCEEPFSEGGNERMPLILSCLTPFDTNLGIQRTNLSADYLQYRMLLGVNRLRQKRSG
jgi:hypothetical protein